jgi:aryl-alcohol dehydrogenase-like predicted oxidoreductase
MEITMANLPTRTLGRTVLEVTTLGYGAMELRGRFRGPELSDEQADRMLNAVLDAGINLIDTSPDYSLSEERIGKYIAHRRDDFVRTSKCGCLVAVEPTPDDLRHVFTPENIRAGVEQSLARMKTDHIDVVQFHGSPSRAELEEDGAVEAL